MSDAVASMPALSLNTLERSYDHPLLELLRTLPDPDPPPWLRARVMAAIAEEARRRERRKARRRTFALLLALQVLAFALHERINP